LYRSVVMMSARLASGTLRRSTLLGGVKFALGVRGAPERLKSAA